MGGLNIKNLRFSFDKSKSLIGEYFLKMTSPSLLTKISNGSPSRMRMVLRISLGITTLPRMVQYVCPLQDRGGRAGGTLSEISIYDYAVGIILAAVGRFGCGADRAYFHVRLVIVGLCCYAAVFCNVATGKSCCICNDRDFGNMTGKRR